MKPEGETGVVMADGNRWGRGWRMRKINKGRRTGECAGNQGYGLTKTGKFNIHSIAL